MKPHWYQWFVKWFGWILAGLLVLGEIFDAFNNAISLMTPTVAVIGTVVLVGGWLLIALAVRRRAPSWHGVDGTEQRIKALGSKPLGFVLGMLLFLWLPTIVDRYRPVTGPYPWISVGTIMLGDPIRVGLTMTVRDYPSPPEEVERGVLSLSSIFGLSATIFTHIRLISTGGEDQCMYSFRHAEFRNELSREKLIGYISLDRDITPISFRISVRNGVWDGYLLLRRHGMSVDYEQVSHGVMIGADGRKRTMTVKEARYGNKIDRHPGLPDKFDREMLRSFGVPVVGPERPPNMCRSTL